MDVSIAVVFCNSNSISAFSPSDEDALEELWHHHCLHSFSKTKSMKSEVVVVVVQEVPGILQHVLHRWTEVFWKGGHVALAIFDLQDLAHLEGR